MTHSRPTKARSTLVITAACIGNFLEFYNFMAFAFFAPMIARAFFPGENWLMQLFYALMTFAVGFVLRPVGAFVMERYSRRAGRKASLMVTFLLMAIGSLLLAATPPAASIGLLAPLLIVVARMLQGFSDGGEVGPATALIFDAAPERMGGMLGSLQYMTQLLGSLVAVVIGLALSELLSHDALYSWGWRVPFVLGLLIVPVGVVLRRLAFADEGAQVLDRQVPLSASAPHEKTALRQAVFFVFIGIMCGTISTYLRNFGVSYAVTVLGLSPSVSMMGMVAGLTAGLVGILIGIRIATRQSDARAIVVSVGLLNAVLSVPLYYYAIHVPGLGSQLALNVTMFLLSSITAVGLWQAMLDALPTGARSSLFGVIYALAVSTFGGMTQPATAWLIAKTHDPMTPAYMMAFVLPAGLLVYLRLHTLARRNVEHVNPEEIARALMAE